MPFLLMKTPLCRRGFTLVEIMIVVAIIALLAALAVPQFLRARERSQATTILNDARLLDAAVDQYGIEQNRTAGAASPWTSVSAYLKPNSRLLVQGGTDLFGSSYVLSNISDGAKVASGTTAAFNTTVVPTTFWAGYR